MSRHQRPLPPRICGNVATQASVMFSPCNRRLRMVEKLAAMSRHMFRLRSVATFAPTSIRLVLEVLIQIWYILQHSGLSTPRSQTAHRLMFDAHDSATHVRAAIRVGIDGAALTPRRPARVGPPRSSARTHSCVISGRRSARLTPRVRVNHAFSWRTYSVIHENSVLSDERNLRQNL